jgi:hypothetical protein
LYQWQRFQTPFALRQYGLIFSQLNERTRNRETLYDAGVGFTFLWYDRGNFPPNAPKFLCCIQLAFLVRDGAIKRALAS